MLKATAWLNRLAVVINLTTCVYIFVTFGSNLLFPLVVAALGLILIFSLIAFKRFRSEPVVRSEENRVIVGKEEFTS
ncbi:MAG: hypothetical protein SGI97_10325 [candidate division Zixibacteria bacterium]|nr:hypothetical protein [candidate division Zixibacteria bacterium]